MEFIPYLGRMTQNLGRKIFLKSENRGAAIARRHVRAPVGAEQNR
jgi:hypothetical protein